MKPKKPRPKNGLKRPSIEVGSPVIVVCGLYEFRSRVGIHLLNPTDSEIEDALRTAERDGFQFIYGHFENVASLAAKRFA